MFFNSMHNTVDAVNIPHMTDTLVSRIEKMLADKQLSARKASLSVSTNKDLFQQIIRKGADANPTQRTVELLARALDVSENWLLTGDDAPVPNSRPAYVGLPSRDAMSRDVPVRGTAAGSMNGRGAFQISPDIIEYVARPPGLTAVRDIYALYVEGDSMEPKFIPGELVYVNPNRPIRVGDAVVIQEQASQNGDTQAYIKIFKKRTGTAILAQQFNPPKEIEFAAAGTIAHKVMTINELFGV